MDRSNALRSHPTLSFTSKPETQPDTASQVAAARLLFKSHWSLDTESAREEPRLRRLLGHISVYDRTRAYAQARSEPITAKATEENELSAYLQHQVPSFEEFRAALRVQLEIIAQVRLAAAQSNNVEEYNSDDDEEEDSDYDSYDGDNRSDEDLAAESDDSLTDYESEGQRSECTSPTSSSANEKYDKGEEEGEFWAVRPLTPFLNSASRVVDS